MIALGIDQGYANLGYSVVEDDGEHCHLLLSGTIKTKSDDKFENRLATIYEFIKKILDSYNIGAIGIERLFYNAPMSNENNKFRNKSASIMKTNMATGIIFLLAGQYQIEIRDFPPVSVKKEIAGSGKAIKQDVIDAVKEFAEREGFVIKTDHQADSIAIALTLLKKIKKEKELIKDEQ